MKNIILTGERPTGPLHIGHYVGSLRRRVELQNTNDYDEIYLKIDNLLHPNNQNLLLVMDPIQKSILYIYPIHN